MSEPRSVAQLVTDRRFGSYLAGNFISNVGNWFQNVAAGIVVFQVTGSNTLVGLVSVLQFVATLLLSPWSGSLADRHDRKRLLMVSQAISAAGALFLAIWVGLEGVEGLPGVWPVLAAAGVIGLGFAIGIAAMNALIPSLVEPPDLDEAIALNSASFTVARAVGPALAGVIIAGLGAGFAFGINVVTFLPLIVVLAVIRPRAVTKRAGDRSVRAGLAYVRRRPAMPWLIVVTLAVGWAGDPVNTLAPAYAEMFGRDEAFVGLMVGVFGAGSAISSLFVGRIRSRLGLLQTAGLGLAMLAMGLVGFASAPNELVLFPSLFVSGVGFLLGVTTTNSNLQGRLDEDMRGRVMALWSMAFLGSRPLAGLVDGVVADVVSPRVGVLAALPPVLLGAWALRRVAMTDGAHSRQPAEGHSSTR